MKIKAFLLGCGLLCGALPGGAALQGIACAAERGSAALVVDTGGGEATFCVALPSATVSGIKLIQLAGEQHGLEYRIEGGAVCRLAGVGPSEGDCFGEYPDFWGYWRGEDSGGWTWSGSGAGSTTVAAGDVEGWSWGSGSDGSSHPQPPAVRYSSVCANDPAPAGEETGPSEDPKSEAPPDRTKGGVTQTSDDSEAVAEGAAEDDDGVSAPPAAEQEKAERKERPSRGSKSRGKQRPPKAKPSSAVSPEVQAASPFLPAGAESEGPPLVGLAGVGAALLIGGAGVIRARRKRIR